MCISESVFFSVLIVFLCFFRCLYLRRMDGMEGLCYRLCVTYVVKPILQSYSALERIRDWRRLEDVRDGASPDIDYCVSKSQPRVFGCV